MLPFFMWCSLAPYAHHCAPLMAQCGWCVFITFSTVSSRRNLTFLEGFGGACGVCAGVWVCSVHLHSISFIVRLDLSMIYRRHRRLLTITINGKQTDCQISIVCDLEFHSFSSIHSVRRQTMRIKLEAKFRFKSHLARAYSIPTRRYDLENNP